MRLPAGLSPDEPPAAARHHAGAGERPGQWLDWTDAIALLQALNQPPTTP